MAPFCTDTTPNTSTNATRIVSIDDDDDDHVRKVAKRSCISKFAIDFFISIFFLILAGVPNLSFVVIN